MSLCFDASLDSRRRVSTWAGDVGADEAGDGEEARLRAGWWEWKKLDVDGPGRGGGKEVEGESAGGELPLAATVRH